MNARPPRTSAADPSPATDLSRETPSAETPSAETHGVGDRPEPEAQPTGAEALDATVTSITGPPSGSPTPVASSGNGGPADAIEAAQTVITGSNRLSIPLHPTGGGTPAEVARVLLGHQLDHFALETLIGGGGMGAVFRARDTRLDRTVAIKVIPRVGDDPELLRRFRNEAQSAARLDHPNIARVYDVGRFEGWHYIVFEYIDGTNLRDLVQRDGLLTVDDAVYFTRQVAEALDHAHQRGVTHRDIKPSNVLVTPGGQVKLVDMGLARAQQLEVSEDLTASGVTLGTFDYISPEQARDPRDADVRSDIYSLGCTLYFALTGRPPYPSGTVLQKLLSHGSSPPPDPRQVRGGLSENLVAVLHKMLAKQPADRYRRPLDLISDLYLLAQREHLPRALSAGSIAVVQPSRFSQLIEQHLPWLVAAALLLITTLWLQLLSSASGDLIMTEPVPPARVAESNGQASASPSESARPGGNAEQRTAALDAEDAKGGSPAATAENRTPTDPEAPPKYADIAPASVLPAALATAADTKIPPAETSPIPSVIRVIGAQADGAGTVDSENRLLVSALGEAFDALGDHPEVSTIEIGPATVRCGPVALPRRGLTIRGVSESSVLEWVSSESGAGESGIGETISGGRTAMFDLGPHNVDFENLHLVWRDRSMSGEGGTLFQMRGGNTLGFSKCSLTVENPLQRSGMYVFETVFDSAAGPTPPLVALRMSDTIVRGEATMWRLERAAARVEVRWDNGLLAISGRMIETGGAAASIASEGARIRLIMNDVTAVPGQGLVRVRLTNGADQPVFVDREANKSVFSLGGNVPLVEMTGLAEPALADSYVLLRGHDNAYDSTGGRTQVILNASGGGGTPLTVGIGPLLAPERPKWIEETLPQGIVVWSNPLPLEVSPHEQVPSNYLLEGSVLPGFHIESLPKLPTGTQVTNDQGI